MKPGGTVSDDVDGGRTRPQAERKGLAREACRGFPYLIIIRVHENV